MTLLLTVVLLGILTAVRVLFTVFLLITTVVFFSILLLITLVTLDEGSFITVVGFAVITAFSAASLI